MKGNAEFIGLINTHQNIIHKVCHLYMDKALDREDLFQEITLQAWKSYSSFRGEAKFSTWLYRIALNTAITFYRKEKRRPSIYTTEQLPDMAADEPMDSTDAQLKAMHTAIAELSKIDKAIVMLYLEDYAYQEIGEMMGMTANNIAVKMSRIKTKLKEQSQKYLDQP